MEDKSWECLVCETRILLCGGGYGPDGKAIFPESGYQFTCVNGHTWIAPITGGERRLVQHDLNHR